MSDGNKFLYEFDGVANHTVFCLWTGDEAMSENRLRAIWTIFNNTACPVVFVTKNTINDWVNPDFPLHPAFEYLSSTHKADYLRCYLMHYYGGGYTDIKITTKKWGVFFDELNVSDKMALGYKELPHGIPHIDGSFGDLLRQSYSELIGLCAFIFKKETLLTKMWLDKTNLLLDEKYSLLQEHPAQHPLDRTGVILPDGQVSNYPLRWAELLGEIFHPLVYEHKNSLLQAPIEPVFSNYR